MILRYANSAGKLEVNLRQRDSVGREGLSGGGAGRRRVTSFFLLCEIVNEVRLHWRTGGNVDVIQQSKRDVPRVAQEDVDDR